MQPRTFGIESIDRAGTRGGSSRSSDNDGLKECYSGENEEKLKRILRGVGMGGKVDGLQRECPGGW